MMPELIQTKEELIMLKGNLTSENVSEVQEYLEEVLNNSREFIIDLTKLKRLDVVGVFMLLILRKKVEKNFLILNHDNEIVTQSIKNSGIQNIVDVV